MTSAKLGSVKESWLKFITLSLMFMVLCCTSQCAGTTRSWQYIWSGYRSSRLRNRGGQDNRHQYAMGTQNSTVTTGAGAIQFRSYLRADTVQRYGIRAGASRS